MHINRLKINGITNPMGFGFDNVIASFNVEDTDSKTMTEASIQVALDEAFETIVFSKEGADLDMKGEALSVALKPRTRYFWRVKVTGDKGDSAISEVQYFETGKMDEKWIGKWIAADEGDTFHPVFKKTIELKEKPISARLYVSCLGVFEAYLDGKKIGNEFLTPYINDYDTGMQVIAFDLTDSISKTNELAIHVGKGWYMSDFGLEGGYNYGDRMCAIAELQVEYANGSSEVIGTDKTWDVFNSDVTESGIYYGEDLDRTTENINHGKAVEVDVKHKLLDRYSVPVIAKEVLEVKDIITTPAGETVLDFGQNHTGIMEIDADFPEGTVITMDCGEVLQNGCFYNDNYRTARARFVYTSDGRKETVHPHFTFCGYRYIRISGWPKGKLDKSKVRSLVLYSDMERTGYIKTGHKKINRLYENCIWGQKSNFLDMPTDCPQRDERLGWTGDAQVFSQTASYNMDTRAFYRKYLTDLSYDAMRHDGGVASFIPNKSKNMEIICNIWGDVATFVPKVIYDTFGCMEDVKPYYAMMKSWVEYMRGVDEANGEKIYSLPFQFGDWLGLDGITEQSSKGGTDDDFLGLLYYYRSTVITANMAGLLGKKDDEKQYNSLAEKIRKDILHEYFSPSGRLVCDTQAAYIVALAFDVYIDRDKLIAQFMDRLKKDCYDIKCGFVGAPLLCTTLSKIGYINEAYNFLFKESFPSWLYCVNLDATTIWERWNSLLPDGSISGTGMNSLNHYSYGTIVQFIYEHSAGLKALEPGFSYALIAPEPDMRLKNLECSLMTASGKYVSDWIIEKDGFVNIHVEIPFGAKARVKLPRFDKASKESLLAKEVLKTSVSESGEIELCTGCYDFKYMPCEDYRFIYTSKTRLVALENDKEAMEILKNELPIAYGYVMDKDVEVGNTALGDLKYLIYRGFAPGSVPPVVEKIYALNRYEGVQA